MRLNYIPSLKNTLILNGGGRGTTDWTDSNSDGVADNWARTGLAATCSIINATDGFSNRAQKWVAALSPQPSNTIYVSAISSTLTKNITYHISFDYKSSIGIQVADISLTSLLTLSASPGGVTHVNTTIVYSGANASYILVFSLVGIASDGDYAIIDNVNVYV